MSWWITVFLVVVVNVLGQTCQYGDSCYTQSLSSHELPSSGFVQTWVMHPTDATVAPENLLLRILSRRGKSVENTPFCTHITIENQPSPNASPLVGPNLFTLLPDLYNDHFAWSNGPEVISFIKHEEDPRKPGVHTGNWLLGNKPGVDSGYVYRTVNASSISPVSISENDAEIEHDTDTQNAWQWLLHQKWTPQPQMSFVCTSKPPASDNRRNNNKMLAVVENVAFDSFDVEFFNVENNDDEDLHTGLLLSALPESLHEQLFPEYPLSLSSLNMKKVPKSQLSPAKSAYYYLWDKGERHFQLLKVVDVLAGVGRPVIIRSKNTYNNNNINSRKLKDDYEEDEAFFAHSSIVSSENEASHSTKQQQLDLDKEDMGVLLGAELAGSKSWRLFFHLFPHETPSFQPIFNTQNTSSFSSFSTSASAVRNVHHPIRTEGYYRVDEIYVEINHQGRAKSGHMLKHAPAANDILNNNNNHNINMVRSLQDRRRSEIDMLLYATQRGDYLWIWESSSPSGEISEVLVKCTHRVVDVAQGIVTLSFQSFAAHRQVLMTQSIARRVTEHYILTILLPEALKNEINEETFDEKHGGNDEFSVTFHSFGGSSEQSRTPSSVSPRHWSSIVFLSHNPATFLIHHLRYKEHQVGHLLSSCFLYHAAVSLPAPLLYAAEILCVLLGSKPVTMIQLSSPSEHQWKFPLVEELSRAIVETSSMYNTVYRNTFNISSNDKNNNNKDNKNGYFPIDHTVFTYGDDETLLIYRTSREYLMESLLPKFSAQALHPMPYPNQHAYDPDALHRAYYDQLYNAAWNGFALGYPAYFVRSYVESFHDNQITDRVERHRIFESAARDFSLHLPRVSRGGLSKRGYEMRYGLDEDLFIELVPVTYLKGTKIGPQKNNLLKMNKKKKNKENTDLSEEQERKSKEMEKEWMKYLWERLNQLSS